MRPFFAAWFVSLTCLCCYANCACTQCGTLHTFTVGTDVHYYQRNTMGSDGCPVIEHSCFCPSGACEDFQFRVSARSPKYAEYDYTALSNHDSIIISVQCNGVGNWTLKNVNSANGMSLENVDSLYCRGKYSPCHRCQPLLTSETPAPLVSFEMTVGKNGLMDECMTYEYSCGAYATSAYGTVLTLVSKSGQRMTYHPVDRVVGITLRCNANAEWFLSYVKGHSDFYTYTLPDVAYVYCHKDGLALPLTTLPSALEASTYTTPTSGNGYDYCGFLTTQLLGSAYTLSLRETLVTYNGPPKLDLYCSCQKSYCSHLSLSLFYNTGEKVVRYGIPELIFISRSASLTCDKNGRMTSTFIYDADIDPYSYVTRIVCYADAANETSITTTLPSAPTTKASTTRDSATTTCTECGRLYRYRSVNNVLVYERETTDIDGCPALEYVCLCPSNSCEDFRIALDSDYLDKLDYTALPNQNLISITMKCTDYGNWTSKSLNSATEIGLKRVKSVTCNGKDSACHKCKTLFSSEVSTPFVKFSMYERQGISPSCLSYAYSCGSPFGNPNNTVLTLISKSGARMNYHLLDYNINVILSCNENEEWYLSSVSGHSDFYTVSLPDVAHIFCHPETATSTSTTGPSSTSADEASTSASETGYNSVGSVITQLSGSASSLALRGSVTVYYGGSHYSLVCSCMVRECKRFSFSVIYNSGEKVTLSTTISSNYSYNSEVALVEGQNGKLAAKQAYSSDIGQTSYITRIVCYGANETSTAEYSTASTTTTSTARITAAPLETTSTMASSTTSTTKTSTKTITTAPLEMTSTTASSTTSTTKTSTAAITTAAPKTTSTTTFSITTMRSTATITTAAPKTTSTTTFSITYTTMRSTATITTVPLETTSTTASSTISTTKTSTERITTNCGKCKPATYEVHGYGLNAYEDTMENDNGCLAHRFDCLCLDEVCKGFRISAFSSSRQRLSYEPLLGSIVSVQLACDANATWASSNIYSSSGGFLANVYRIVCHTASCTDIATNCLALLDRCTEPLFEGLMSRNCALTCGTCS